MAQGNVWCFLYALLLGLCFIIGLFVLADVFFGFIAFSDKNITVHAETDEEMITSKSNLTLPVNTFGACESFAVQTWRAHRVGKSITMGFQGICQDTNTSETFLNVDVSLENLPSAFRTPSPNTERVDVSGTGSALVEGFNIATVVEVDGDSSLQNTVDIDVRFGTAYPMATNIEVSALFIYKADV